jgi:hypothetical protein
MKGWATGIQEACQGNVIGRATESKRVALSELRASIMTRVNEWA